MPEGAEARGYHVGEDVAVVVRAGPEYAARVLHHLGHRVVDEEVAVGDAGVAQRVRVARRPPRRRCP